MVIARCNASLQDVLSVPQPLVVVSEGRVHRFPALCTRPYTSVDTPWPSPSSWPDTPETQERPSPLRVDERSFPRGVEVRCLVFFTAWA